MGALAPRRALKTPQQLKAHLLDQGLVISNAPLVRWKDGKANFEKPGPAIITSNGCACEDYERAVVNGQSSKADRVMLQVAPIKKADTLNNDKVETIRSGEHLDFFFIEGEDRKLEDSIVDLTREQGIPASVLAGCAKRALIADWQWRGLLVHIAVSRFHQQPEKLFLKELLESRSDAA